MVRKRRINKQSVIKEKIMLKNDAFVKIKLEKELCKDDCEKQEKKRK